MNMEKYLVTVAGGKGTRMGAGIPKQFIRLGSKPILHLTIEKFVKAVPGLKVITVLPEGNIEEWKKYCYDSNFIVPQTLVAGGITRFHSVRNALEKVPDGALVAIHDGVRPLVSATLINRLFELASEYGGAVPVLPQFDTIKVLGPEDENGLRVEDEHAVADRSILFGAQTPQTFKSELIRQAYSRPYDTAFTDDASVARSYGLKVVYTRGERSNIKITTPEDLAIAEAFMSI